jgi:hypothetical protein
LNLQRAQTIASQPPALEIGAKHLGHGFVLVLNSTSALPKLVDKPSPASVCCSTASSAAAAAVLGAAAAVELLQLALVLLQRRYCC